MATGNVHMAWVQTLALPLINCVTRGKLLILSGSQLPICKMGQRSLHLKVVGTIILVNDVPTMVPETK